MISPRQVEITAAARFDLRRVMAWHTQPGSGPAARRKLARLFHAIDALADRPCQSRRMQDGTPILVVSLHRIAYIVTPDTGDSATAGDVLVLRIFGPGQNSEGL